jgi:hypothetical protein
MKVVQLRRLLLVTVTSGPLVLSSMVAAFPAIAQVPPPDRQAVFSEDSKTVKQQEAARMRKATGAALATATASVGPDIGVGGDHGGGSVVVDGGSGCYASDGSAADGDLFGNWFHLRRRWFWRQLLLRFIWVPTLRRLFGSHRAWEN